MRYHKEPTESRGGRDHGVSRGKEQVKEHGKGAGGERARGRHASAHARGGHEGGRGRMRHGDVRAAILLALEAGPAHGYEVGQRLEVASGHAWRPSPGSIYPTLQLLSDEDAVSSEERDGKRIYTLGKRGRAELEERRNRGDVAPWQAAAEGNSGELREAMVALKMAAQQINAAGSETQRTEATRIIVDARRKLYGLLAKG